MQYNKYWIHENGLPPMFMKKYRNEYDSKEETNKSDRISVSNWLKFKWDQVATKTNQRLKAAIRYTFPERKIGSNNCNAMFSITKNWQISSICDLKFTCACKIRYTETTEIQIFSRFIE